MIASAFAASMLSGCGPGNDESPPEPPEPPEPSAQSEASESAAAPSEENSAEDAEEALEEDLAALEVDGRALLQRWLRAQNEGDFETYRTLYAERFTGTKRSEDRGRSYDHDGWLENRERMFRRPMTVTADEIVVEASARMVVMTFVQGWRSATYEDRGPKRIVAVREGVLRIVSEEMLRSDTRTPQALDLSRLMPVVPLGRPHVLLSANAHPSWERGSPRLEPKVDGVWSVSFETDGLPPELAARDGEEVDLVGAEGDVCQGTLGTPRVLLRTTPHWSIDGFWGGSIDREGEYHEAGVTPPSDAVIAAQIPEHARRSRDGILVAPVEGCDEGLFATRRGANLALFEASPAPPAMVRHIRSQQEWRDTQTAWLQEWDDRGDEAPTSAWDDAPASQSVHEVWTHEGRQVLTSVSSYPSGCGDFYGILAQVFEHGDAWNRVFVEDHDVVFLQEPGVHPLAVVDVEGTGALTLVFRDGVLQQHEAGGTFEVGVDIAIMDEGGC